MAERAGGEGWKRCPHPQAVIGGGGQRGSRHPGEGCLVPCEPHEGPLQAWRTTAPQMVLLHPLFRPSPREPVQAGGREGGARSRHPTPSVPVASWRPMSVVSPVRSRRHGHAQTPQEVPLCPRAHPRAPRGWPWFGARMSDGHWAEASPLIINYRQAVEAVDVWAFTRRGGETHHATISYLRLRRG